MNLHSNISALANFFAMSSIIRSVILSTTVISIFFVSAAFIEYKNEV